MLPPQPELIGWIGADVISNPAWCYVKAKLYKLCNVSYTSRPNCMSPAVCDLSVYTFIYSFYKHIFIINKVINFFHF